MTSRPDDRQAGAFKNAASPGLDPGVHEQLPLIRGWPGQARPREKKISIAGFTLIELLVVLAIIGMTLAMALPLLARHVTGATLNAASDEIRAALRGARSTAIAEDRPVIFRGDPGGGYWLDRNHFTLPLMSGAQPLRVATLGGAQISFYPSGGSSGGRILVVSGSAQREIAVDTLTGRADER
jgi:general secretion pathway protein H